jgi:LysR family hydrogen peroxide-inducible transcriptional activator
MSRTRPSVRQLEYLVAVADTLHFGRAARRCAVTQPALSAQIQQLEEILGVQVFERSRRRVIPTAVGERVIAEAREALQQVDALAEVARSSREPLAGPLRLGVIPTVAPYLLPPTLPAVRRTYPGLELLLREETTRRLIQQLREGRLDLLLLALPLDEADVEELALLEEPFVLVAPRSHRLGRGASPVAEDDLAEEEVLLLEDGHCLRDQALSLCERVGAREAGRIQATSLSTLVQMVANGLGVTLLPRSALPLEVRPEAGLATRPFRAPAPSRTVGLAWRRASARGEEFRRLGELLAREARPLVSGRAPGRRRAAR